LRSKAKSGKTIGVMITASHNPVKDNGVKLIDPMGEMLEASWEKHATDLANASNDSLPETLQSIVTLHKIDLERPANIVVARDTRPSGLKLKDALEDGISSVGEEMVDCGLLTTPQLHYIVRCINTNEKYGKPTEDGYYEKLSFAFKNLIAMFEKSSFGKIKIDGANGIGAVIVRKILGYCELTGAVTVTNDGSHGILNDKCGADYVKVQQNAPIDFEYSAGDKGVSFDGDADRIVYFYKDSGNIFHLLDGDKIATLIASYLKEKLDIAQINLPNGLGVVQTAYANGSSTEYLQNYMKIPVACTKTGVKHLHHRAQEFDVGVYFEANGHGTVIFSDDAVLNIRKAASDEGDLPQKNAAQSLAHFIDLTNETVGDAISDMLIVESILYERKWTCSNWDACYQDLPNKQCKIKVKDRTVVQTTDSERKVLSPQKLQEGIDKLVQNISKARSFVRPSGTEDVVRIYAEAETKEMVEYLSASVSQLVYDLCDGVGARPEVPEQVNCGTKRKFPEDNN